VNDVFIIGSGAAGGMAAKLLAEGGLNVVMLEAGPDLDPARDCKVGELRHDLVHPVESQHDPTPH
jgi:choline dehydrogenase-like flavoprotein